MKIRKFIQIVEHEVFTMGLADDGTLWNNEGNNVWRYSGEVPQFKKPELFKYYVGGLDEEC